MELRNSILNAVTINAINIGSGTWDVMVWLRQYRLLFCPFLCQISIEVSFTVGSMGLDFICPLMEITSLGY